MNKTKTLLTILITAALITAILGTTITTEVVSWALIPYKPWFSWPTIFGWIFPMLPFPF